MTIGKDKMIGPQRFAAVNILCDLRNGNAAMVTDDCTGAHKEAHLRHSPQG